MTTELVRGQNRDFSLSLAAGWLADHGHGLPPTNLSSYWDTFLAATLPDGDLRGFPQRVGGLALVGNVVERVLPILTGNGRNWMGTFVRTVAASLGPFAIESEPGLFWPVNAPTHPVKPATTTSPSSSTTVDCSTRTCTSPPADCGAGGLVPRELARARPALAALALRFGLGLRLAQRSKRIRCESVCVPANG